MRNPGLTTTRLVASWLQTDVGDAIDLKTLPPLAPMNPSGTSRLRLDIVVLMQKIPGPMLVRLKRRRDMGCAAGVPARA